MRYILATFLLCLTLGVSASVVDSLKVEKRAKRLSRAPKKELVAVDTAKMDTLFVTDTIKVAPKDDNTPTLERAWRPVVVDHHIGVRGGWGFGSIRREPGKENVGLPWSLWNGGITYHFDVPSQKYVGCIEVGLGFMEKGYAYKYSSTEDNAYARKYTVLELPILWQPYFPIGKQGTRIYLSAGPFLSYTLSGTQYEFNSATGEMLSQEEYKYDDMKDYRWGYGVTVGGGVVVAIGRFAISAEFRYSIGLSDVERGPEFVPGNPFRTPVDQMSVSLGVRYKFSIGKEKQNE